MTPISQSILTLITTECNFAIIRRRFDVYIGQNRAFFDAKLSLDDRSHLGGGEPRPGIYSQLCERHIARMPKVLLLHSTHTCTIHLAAVISRPLYRLIAGKMLQLSVPNRASSVKRLAQNDTGRLIDGDPAWTKSRIL